MEHGHDHQAEQGEGDGQLGDRDNLGASHQPHWPQYGVTQLADQEHVGRHIGEGVDSVVCDIEEVTKEN